MVKMTRLAPVGALLGLGLGMCLLGGASAARALTTSDKPASILVWPKLVVNTNGLFSAPPTDTLIQLSNTSTTQLKQAHCFYVNANSHCAGEAENAGAVCQSAVDCPSGSGFAACVPGWSEIDFDVVLTKDQPLAWHVGSGLARGDFPLLVSGTCHNLPTRTCSAATAFQCPGGLCDLKQSNLGSGVPPAPEDPFVGSLTCIEFDPTANPPAPDTSDTADTLKGEGSIETVVDGLPNLEKYNAVGMNLFRQLPGQDFGTLVLPNGAAGVGYTSCPTTLILNHLFDGASFNGGPTSTDLTLVPCGNNFLTQTPGVVTAQFLVFNEFEQRFSTSRTVDCFLESNLSNIDTTNSSRSIFSVNVSGTLAGQTRIRGVGSAATGRGLVGVARLLPGTVGAAYNLFQQGSPNILGGATQPDLIVIP